MNKRWVASSEIGAIERTRGSTRWGDPEYSLSRDPLRARPGGAGQRGERAELVPRETDKETAWRSSSRLQLPSYTPAGWRDYRQATIRVSGSHELHGPLVLFFDVGIRLIAAAV